MIVKHGSVHLEEYFLVSALDIIPVCGGLSKP